MRFIKASLISGPSYLGDRPKKIDALIPIESIVIIAHSSYFASHFGDVDGYVIETHSDKHLISEETFRNIEEKIAIS